MLLESEHSSEDPGICLQTTLKIEIFVAAVKKATLDHFKSDLSNFSYKDKGILKKKNPNKFKKCTTENFKAEGFLHI